MLPPDVVSFPLQMWAGSSAGRASRSQCEGRGFDPHPVHYLILILSLRLILSGVAALVVLNLRRELTLFFLENGLNLCFSPQVKFLLMFKARAKWII
jgi:hypothetical protein